MVECFFFIESDSEGDDGTVRALCLGCRSKKPKNFRCWFYSGLVGPWTVKCRNCGDVIHLHNGDGCEEVTGTNETSTSY